MKEKIFRCMQCGALITWSGKGRKPKYCEHCKKEMKRLQNLKSYHKNKPYKHRLSKNDMWQLAMQKKAA